MKLSVLPPKRKSYSPCQGSYFGPHLGPFIEFESKGCEGSFKFFRYLFGHGATVSEHSCLQVDVKMHCRDGLHREQVHRTSDEP